MTDEKPYIIIEAIYKEMPDNRVNIRVKDSNFALNGDLWHKTYHLGTDFARGLAVQEKKSLEIKLTVEK